MGGCGGASGKVANNAKGKGQGKGSGKNQGRTLGSFGEGRVGGPSGGGKGQATRGARASGRRRWSRWLLRVEERMAQSTESDERDAMEAADNAIEATRLLETAVA